MKVYVELFVNFLIKKKKEKRKRERERERRKNVMKLVTRWLSKKSNVCMVSVIYHASTVLAVPCFDWSWKPNSSLDLVQVIKSKGKGDGHNNDVRDDKDVDERKLLFLFLFLFLAF